MIVLYFKGYFPNNSSEINLNNRGIVSIDAFTFKGYDDIEKLDLSNNLLSTIDLKTFGGLDQLVRSFNYRYSYLK